MEVYLVGGAVRDRLLGLPVRERDWVVVGTTPEEMIERGYRQVGRDFPVFLHPETGEEYALARSERKSGHGYHGFEFDSSPDVTLEDDLRRRDLTVNAMAESPDGGIIDPWGGRQDLEERVLRHVSPAFSEDPLRVLRAARFTARFTDLGFTLAGETLGLMAELSQSGELEHLTPERVWQETANALEGPRPGVYFHILYVCGALQVRCSACPSRKSGTRKSTRACTRCWRWSRRRGCHLHWRCASPPSPTTSARARRRSRNGPATGATSGAACG